MAATGAERPDRVLATVLKRTARVEAAAPESDHGFLDHVQRQVSAFRGRGLTHTADGFFAAFDGPRPRHRLRAHAGHRPDLYGRAQFGLHTGECDVTPGGRVSGVALERARRSAASPARVKCWSRGP